MLGIVLGLVILVSIFLLPFGSGANSQTLYGTAGPLLSDIGSIQSSGDASKITYDYLIVVAFILIIIAGFVGLFPLGTGVLGVVGMAMITVGSYLIYPNSGTTLSAGLGFFTIWAASIVSLGASFWHGKKKEVPPVTVNVTQVQKSETPQSQE